MAACNADATCEMLGADLTGGDITGVGKLTVATIDPVYEINDTQYATYVADTIGLKMEHYDKIHLTRNTECRATNETCAYVHVIDFARAPEGSDIWLLWQTIKEGDGMEDIVLTLTPEGMPATVWYELKPTQRQIKIYGDAPATVSYHLAAPRFDQSKWPTRLEKKEKYRTVLPLR